MLAAAASPTQRKPAVHDDDAPAADHIAICSRRAAERRSGQIQ
jgi:hypothetical protein